MTATVVDRPTWAESAAALSSASRRILGLLIGRDLKVRYADSTLGYLWSVLEPLLMAGVYWFVFTKIFRGCRRGP